MALEAHQGAQVHIQVHRKRENRLDIHLSYTFYNVYKSIMIYVVRRILFSGIYI